MSDLTQRAEYSFTVAGVDAGDRVGENSMSSDVVIFNSECQNIKHTPIPEYMYIHVNDPVCLYSHTGEYNSQLLSRKYIVY